MKNDGKLKKIIFTVRVCVLSLSLSALTTLTCLAASPKDAKSVVSPPSSSSLKKPSPIPPPTPNAPSNLTAVALNSNAIHITWRDNANTERGFLIERSTSSDGLFMQIATLDANATSYDNAALTADTTYYYRVCAYTLGSTSAYSNTAYAKTLSTAAGGYLPVNKIAVSALIKFASPGVDTASLNLGNLTPAQITSLRKSLVDLQGKKFMVFKGAVVILTDIIIQVTNTNDIISMNILKNGVRKGTVELADLTGIRTFKPLDPFAPWYDYLYTVLENLVKKAAPGATMKAEGLNKSAKSYLDKRFAGVGGSENFEISAEDNYLSVDPKETNNLTGLDKFISMSFENDPLAYNKNAIIEYLQSFKDEIIDNDADFFYIAGEDVEGGAEFMSVYDINKIIAQNQALTPARQTAVAAFYPAEKMSYNPQGSSASPTCYDGISGSVIPCNDQIDWVDTGVSILGIPHSHFFAPFKKLEKLGYTFNPIEQKKYSYEGIDFLKAVVKSKGQIFLQLFHKFKNDHFGNPADGFHSPFGCIPGKAIEDGSFLNKLNQLGDTYFNKTLKKNDIFFERCAFKCGPFNFGWGIRLSDTTIGPKAIQAGYMCYGGTSKLRAKAYYINIDDHMAGPAGAPDMRLFSKYLLGLGPDSRYYETYPPQLDRCHNVDVANIGDYGGPCLAQGNAIPCEAGLAGAFRWVEATTDSWGPSVVNGRISVQIPIRNRPEGAAHLFPYINSLDLLGEGAVSQIGFSDDIAKAPTLDFMVNGRKAIEYGPILLSDSKSVFLFKLFPEIAVVNQDTYDTYRRIKKDRYIPKSILTIKDAKAQANNITMIGNPLATNTKKDKTYNQEYFLYNQYFWNYNARAQGSDTDMHTFKANVPYKLHPWVDNLDIISNWLQSGQTVRFDFSSDVEAVPPCQVITVDASQCTNLKAIYSKGGSPKFIENEEKTGYRSLQFSLEEDITLYRQGDLSLADTKNWKTALKIILKSGSGSGLHSAKNKFPLQGNTAKPTFWNLVRSPGGVVDAWIGNSDKFPQTQGDFTVWIPCAPRKSACCVPSEDGNFSTCQNTTPQQCTALGGNFSDGKNCLKYDHIGTPGADGKMTGRCPGTCPRKPQAFTFRLDQTSTSCDCGVTPEGTPEACPQIQAENQRIADFSNSGVGQHCPGTFSSSMFGKATIPGDSCVPDDTFMGASNNYPHISPNAILHFPVKDATPISPGPYTCPDNPFYSREGEIDCNGGFLTQTTTCTNDDETSSTCSRTTTITISKPLCPADSYAAEDKNGKITCCKVNEEWDREEGVCKPIYTGQYCS